MFSGRAVGVWQQTKPRQLVRESLEHAPVWCVKNAAGTGRGGAVTKIPRRPQHVEHGAELRPQLRRKLRTDASMSAEICSMRPEALLVLAALALSSSE